MESQTLKESSSSDSIDRPLQATPREKRKSRVSFRTIKYSTSRGIGGKSDSGAIDETTIHEIQPLEPVEEKSSAVTTSSSTDYIVLRSDKSKPEGSITCKPSFPHEEVQFLEDIFVVGENDEPVLELETYEWVSLQSHFQTAEDKDMQHMNQPSKTTDASEITLQSSIIPPKYFFDKKKNNYFVLDGIHRTFYLRRATATHVLALVSSLYDISHLDNQEFWKKNYVVENWEQLRAKLAQLASDNLVKL